MPGLGGGASLVRRPQRSTPAVVIKFPAGGDLVLTAPRAAGLLGALIRILIRTGDVVVRLTDDTPATFLCAVRKDSRTGGSISVTYDGAAGGISVPDGYVATIAGYGDEMRLAPAGGRTWAITGDLQPSS